MSFSCISAVLIYYEIGVNQPIELSVKQVNISRNVKLFLEGIIIGAAQGCVFRDGATLDRGRLSTHSVGPCRYLTQTPSFQSFIYSINTFASTSCKHVPFFMHHFASFV